MMKTMKGKEDQIDTEKYNIDPIGVAGKERAYHRIDRRMIRSWDQNVILML